MRTCTCTHAHAHAHAHTHRASVPLGKGVEGSRGRGGYLTPPKPRKPLHTQRNPANGVFISAHKPDVSGPPASHRSQFPANIRVPQWSASRCRGSPDTTTAAHHDETSATLPGEVRHDPRPPPAPPNPSSRDIAGTADARAAAAAPGYATIGARTSPAHAPDRGAHRPSTCRSTRTRGEGEVDANPQRASKDQRPPFPRQTIPVIAAEKNQQIQSALHRKECAYARILFAFSTIYSTGIRPRAKYSHNPKSSARLCVGFSCRRYQL